MNGAEIKSAFPTEAALCECFIATIRDVDGWTIYPETAGFDILAVYKTGHQLGIEAKLRLNSKVADQIIPNDYELAYKSRGPDFRAVIVPQGGGGIARLLNIVGVMVWAPSQCYRLRNDGYGAKWSFEDAIGLSRTFSAARYDFDECAAQRAANDARGWRAGWGEELRWHDWNPEERCELPEFVPNVPAGVPAPVRLTPWKVGALKVLAKIESVGFITAKEVRGFGVDPRRFCATDGWLESLGDGKWGRGKIPAFDHQHPEAYSEILAKQRSEQPA